MEIFGKAFLGLIIIACIFLVRKFSQKQIPFHLKVFTVISWICCFWAYALLPIDIYFVGTLLIRDYSSGELATQRTD
jgi:hypothetical protein